MNRNRFRPTPALRLALALLSLCLPGAALAAFVPLEDGATPAPPRITADSPDPWRIEGSLAIPGLELRPVTVDGEPFSLVTLPGEDLAAEVGRPRLPVIRLLAPVPRGATLSLDVDPGPTREVFPAALGLPHRPVPVQPPVPKLPDAEQDRPLVLDEAVYGSDTPWPAGAGRIVSRAVVRGREIALIELHPVRWDPASGALLVHPEMRFVLRAKGGDPCPPARNDSPVFERAFFGDLLLREAPPPPACSPATEAADGGRAEPGHGSTGGAEGMLVIVHDDFAAAIDPFVDWKRRTGWKVEVVRLSEIGSNPSDQDVKDVIQDRYDTWTDPPLGYVLVVGDTDFTPIHWGNGGGHSQVTDNWYACLDGDDYLPDVEIARISTRSAQETEDVVDKLLTYEKATFAGETWVKRAGFIGTSDSGHISLIEGTHDWCIDTFYTPNDYEETSWSHGKESCDRHYHTYDADTSEIAASIDEGRSVVNYSGHGSETSWQGPTSHGGYDQADVRNNTNDGMYPFVISNACVTGTLNRDECFGETWQKVPHKGAIGFLGASNSSYWDEDDYFQRRLHTHIFPMDDTPALGTIVRRAKMDLYDHYGNTGTVQYYFEMYNLLSEPSVSLWTRRPRDLDVQHDSEVPTGAEEFTVTVKRDGQPVEGELVAVRKQDEGIFAAGYTDADGVCVLPLDPPPQEPGPMEVTVTGHDDRPYLGSTDVVPMDGPWLVLDAVDVDDSAAGCDADGIADIGEDALFLLTIRNRGSEPATNVRVTLSSSADVAVLDNPAELGTIPPDGTAVAALTVRVGAGVGCMEEAGFTATLSCDGADDRDQQFDRMLEADERDDHHFEDVEHGGGEPAGWSHEALQGTDDWAVTTSDNHTAGGAYAWHASDSALQKDVVLLTDVLHPDGAATFGFWQRYELTVGKSAATIEITTDGGATWTDLGPWITVHPYDHEIGQGLEKHDVWSGSSGGWVYTEVDLASFAGRDVRIRFRLGALNGSGQGWWIDDTDQRSIFTSCDGHACGIPDEVRITSVTREDGKTVLRWWDDPVAAHYRAWRSNDPSSADNFSDVTSEDDDDTDAVFRDGTDAGFACWIVQGVGPDGDGPWGHYGR